MCSLLPGVRFLYTSRLLHLSENFPIVIEIAEGKEKMEKFLPKLGGIVEEGLIILEKTKIIKYTLGKE